MSFVSNLAFKSMPALLFWKMAGRSFPVTLTLADGTRFELRPQNLTDRDYGVAYEVFVHRFYELKKRFADRNEIKLIYDLGANVGFSCLYWLASFPAARIVAYEPHPRHVEQCRRNLILNGWESRVELHSSAAAPCAGRVTLSDAGASSALMGRGESGIEVPMEDFFRRSDGDPIDILKMDIEGGEFALLEDERFSQVSAKLFIMEWHESDSRTRGRAWCRTRLHQLGYDVSDIWESDDCGMLIAERS